MFQSVNELKNYEVRSIDGTIGKLENFLFEDLELAIKFIVVSNLKKKIPKENILISTQTIDEIKEDKKIIRLSKTKSDVENNTDMSFFNDTSNQDPENYEKYIETELDPKKDQKYKRRAKNGGKDSIPILNSIEVPITIDKDSPISELKSTDELIGYDIKAKDGDIGQVKDLMINPDNWSINYLLVNSKKWMGDRRVLISPSSIKEINWENNSINVNLLLQTIINAPTL